MSIRRLEGNYPKAGMESTKELLICRYHETVKVLQQRGEWSDKMEEFLVVSRG